MLTFEREYFERPVYGPDTQCVMDLMAGKITITEVPFAYRGKREFNCAFQYTKSLPYEQAEIERELIRKQMLDDIAECRRRGKRGGKKEKDIVEAYARLHEEERLVNYSAIEQPSI